MIDSITSQTLAVASAGTSTTTTAASGGFNAALDAERKAEAAKQARASELDAIKTKGFSTWVRDTQIEKLKEELRKKVMAEMGVDDDSLSKLSSVMREILEKKIQEEVDKRLQEETAKQQDDKDHTTTASAQQPQQAGKNNQDGKTCPVIPALSWPGAASL